MNSSAFFYQTYCLKKIVHTCLMAFKYEQNLSNSNLLSSQFNSHYMKISLDTSRYLWVPLKQWPRTKYTLEHITHTASTNNASSAPMFLNTSFLYLFEYILKAFVKALYGSVIAATKLTIVCQINYRHGWGQEIFERRWIVAYLICSLNSTANSMASNMCIIQIGLVLFTITYSLSLKRRP